MLLGLEVGLLIIGVFALVSGKLTLGKNRMVRGTPARLLGLVGLLSIPLAFLVIFLLGMFATAMGSPLDTTDPGIRFTLTCVELLVAGLCATAMYAIGNRLAGPAEAKPTAPEFDLEFAPAAGLVPRKAPSASEWDQDLGYHPTETSGKAIASLVLGFCSFLTCLFTGIPAIWVGIRGLMDIKASRGMLKGSGLAITGLVLGSLSTIFSLILIVALTLRLQRDPQEDQPAQPVFVKNQAGQPIVDTKASPVLAPPPADTSPRSARPQKRKPSATSTLAITPNPVNTPLKTKRTRVDDLDVTKVEGIGKDVVPSLVWSVDGTSFYCLSKNAGVIHKVTLEGLVEDTRLEIGQPAAWLSMSSSGLLVALPNLQEVWVVDPSSLEVVKKIGSLVVTRVASSPGSSIAFATSQKPHAIPEEVDILDLDAGLSLGQVKTSQLGRSGGFGFTNLSPDGTHLYTLGTAERIVSYRFDGETLSEEATGPRIGQNPQDLILSPDGKRIALPSGGGNYVPDDSHPPQNYGTYLYDPSDLNKPVSVIESGAYPRTLGFDVKNDVVYAQNSENDLLTFQTNGTSLRAYKTATGTPSRFLSHPDNGKLLVVNDKGELFEIKPATGPAEEPAKKKSQPSKKPMTPRSKSKTKKNDNS